MCSRLRCDYTVSDTTVVTDHLHPGKATLSGYPSILQATVSVHPPILDYGTIDQAHAHGSHSEASNLRAWLTHDSGTSRCLFTSTIQEAAKKRGSGDEF